MVLLLYTLLYSKCLEHRLAKWDFGDFEILKIMNIFRYSLVGAPIC